MIEEDYIKTIQVIDPFFNELEFKKWCQETLILLQEAWSNEDKKILAKYETKKLYTLHAKQLDGMQANDVVNITKDLCINQIELVDVKTSKTEILITVILQVSLIDYYTKTNSSVVIRGKKEPILATYTLTITRSKEFLSNQFISKETTSCPYCGAPMKDIS